MKTPQQEMMAYLQQLMLQLYHDMPGDKNQKNKVIREGLDSIGKLFDLGSGTGDLDELKQFWTSYQDDPDLAEYAGTYLFAIEDVVRGFQHMHDLKNP